MLGIECDGASYHSGKSARDRDRLRQEILENLGWKIYRIWSTDWFKSRKREIERLTNRVKTLVAEDPEYRRQAERLQSEGSVRQQLLDLRENEIRAAFPDFVPEKCILRDELLEVFVTKRPRSKDDWFRLFSVESRTKTDSRQVSRFLTQILQITKPSD